MTISYNWLCEYLPFETDPNRLSRILTSVGLEVEGLHRYEEIKGGLEGIVIGEVLECTQHPDADKLKLTKVNIGSGESILCPPAKGMPASLQMLLLPSITFCATAGDKIFIGQPNIAIAKIGFPPMA